MEECYPCPKLTPKQWIENFWYYNKWYVLVAIVFLSLIAIATFQFFKKSEADASILYAGASILSDDCCEKVIDSAQEKLFDVNDDGKVVVEMQNFVLSSDFDLLKNEGQRIQAREEFQAYSDEILSGDGCILLLDEYYYSELAQKGALVNLYEIYEELPKSAVDYFGLRLGDTSLYKLDGFSSLPEDTFVCLKFAPVVGKDSAEEKAIRDQYNRELFKSLIGD